MDYDGEWQGLPLDRYILPPAMPSDMLQSQCVLDHASTGKEGNSAKKKKRNSIRTGVWKRRQTKNKLTLIFILPDLFPSVNPQVSTL